MTEKKWNKPEFERLGSLADASGIRGSDPSNPG